MHEELRVLDEEISRLERILDEQSVVRRVGGALTPISLSVAEKGGSVKNKARNVIRSRADQGFYSVGRVAKGEGLKLGIRVRFLFFSMVTIIEWNAFNVRRV